MLSNTMTLQYNNSERYKYTMNILYNFSLFSSKYVRKSAEKKTI